MAIVYLPDFSVFFAFVWAFSWREPKIPIMPQLSDARNMMPVPNNQMAPATAVAIGNALLNVCFFLVSVPFKKEDTSFYFVQIVVGVQIFHFCSF